ncbi:MAG: sulfatase-like hydrolase/transferase [Paludibacteraceae bacterium]|nr:sulfatase-like hydrolase/transferase [Paludibacteraceae bacterium]
MERKSYVEKLKDKGQIILFLVFVLGVFHNCKFFGNVIWPQMETEFMAHHMPKLVAAIALGAPIFLFKRFSVWYALILSLFIDVWIIANFIYFRCNGVLLNSIAISMVGNMEGFWNSVFLFMTPKVDVIPFLVTILTIVPLFFITGNKFMPRTFICVILCLYPLALWSHHSDVEKRGYWDSSIKYEPDNLYKVFSLTECESFEGRNDMFNLFDVDPSYNSVIHLLIDDLRLLRCVKESCENINMPPEDEQRLLNVGITRGLKEGTKYNTKLVVLLMESMECWALSPESMPNLWNFIQTHNHFRAARVKSQIRQGASSDGQMILNTGLLPLKQGAACYLFPNSTYPSLCKLTDNKSICIVPHSLTVWNQLGMSRAYAYTDNYCMGGDDKDLFAKLNQLIEEDEYQVIQLITLSTHANFESVSGLSDLQLPADMPVYSQNFLKSFNYVDKYLGTFLAKIDSSEAFKNVTFIITGDHTIFPHDKRMEMKQYSLSHNDVYNPESYVNAIIYSPNLDRTIVVEDEAYQMDLYPTITAVLGAGFANYKGVGVNLLDSVARTNRILSHDEALGLSDKIIRSDFFKQ